MQQSAGTEQDPDTRIYLDLVPVRSFLHTPSGWKSPNVKDTFTYSTVPVEDQEALSQTKEVGN